MIDTETLTQLQARLQAERTQLESEFARRGIQVGVNADGSPDWGTLPAQPDESEEDFTVQADRVEEFETATATQSLLESRYQDVYDALQKLANGTYGVCEVSGEPIELDRLMANPAARTNKAHMESQA